MHMPDEKDVVILGRKVSSPPLPYSVSGMDRQHVYLHAGGLYVSDRGALVTTVLGSCVSVCLWDEGAPRVGEIDEQDDEQDDEQPHCIGGINHFMLPAQFSDEQATNRHGNIAVRALVREMLTLGAEVRRMRAMVCGGGRVLGQSGRSAAGMDMTVGMNIGELNIERAFDELSDLGICVVSSCTGGAYGRKIVFDTKTGCVRVSKHLSSFQ